MHNSTTGSSFLAALLCLERDWERRPIISIPVFLHGYYHGNLTIPRWMDMGVVMLPLHASTSLTSCFLILFLLFFSILFSKLLWSLYHKTTSSTKRTVSSVQLVDDSHDETDAVSSSADQFPEKEDLVADVVLGGEALLFLSKKGTSGRVDTLLAEQGKKANEQDSCEADDTFVSESVYGSPMEDLVPESKKLDVECSDVPIGFDVSTVVEFSIPNVSVDCDVTVEEKETAVEACLHKEERNSLENEKFSIVDHPHPGSKDFKPQEVHLGEEYESSTGGSTSKSSGEWRSSTNFRDTETEHLFSSSSRRSSSKWESYTVFRKYDEEMMFFDRISAQKLTETESLRSVGVYPRSISKRIVHKLTTKNKQFRKSFKDPYRELEAAYVAQICLTWEALNWNYKNFQQVVHANRHGEDSGCSAQIAQLFQQFQVLLQRYIENEPYEHGRRPEVCARMRIAAPKLLQVPEFREGGDESKEDWRSWISSAKFLRILEDAIRTFMNFLKADKEKHWPMLKDFVKKKPSSINPALLHLIKKTSEKKKRRLKNLLRRRKCLRKRKLKEEEEMEILMGMIDMKVVSRVLRMPEISEEQLHWCEDKISKVRVWEGKMQRDSSPLFFPSH